MNKNLTATLMPINNAKYLSLLDQVMLLLIVITLQDIYIFNNLVEIHSLHIYLGSEIVKEKCNWNCTSVGRTKHTKNI